MSISLNGFAEESITLKMAGTAAKGTPVSISASLTAAPSQADGVLAGHPPARKHAHGGIHLRLPRKPDGERLFPL